MQLKTHRHKVSKSIASVLLAVLLLFALPHKALAWGKEGHQMVADIAFQFLDATTKQKVLSYLDGMSIEDASTWMDDMRSNPEYDYMSSWHFVNIEKGEKYSPTSEPDMISVLNKTINELKQKNTLSKAQVKTDILLLFHLVGDLQQPLHCGYGSDKGGNSIEVHFLRSRSKSSLHHVWDSEIIHAKQISVSDCMAIYRTYTVDDVVKVISGSVVGWAYESRSYLPQVYSYNKKTIDESYVNSSTIIVEKQLLNGGLRLASLLLTCFSK